MTNPKTQTFETPDAALDNARKLFAKGEISKEEFARTAKKLQELQLAAWLAKKYPGKK